MWETVGRSAPAPPPAPLSPVGKRFPLGTVGDKMNRLHRWYCQSNHWRHRLGTEILPWSLKGVDLGGEVLELGPGPGLTTDWLRPNAGTSHALNWISTWRALCGNVLPPRTSRRRSVTPRPCHSATRCFQLFSHLPCSTTYLPLLCKTACLAKLTGFSNLVETSPARIACGPYGCR